ncbi:MAG: hypothetical protein LUF33_07095 [Clostridiales bacterium]|nr:hypothetical protein [Clostridiales bacterium]
MILYRRKRHFGTGLNNKRAVYIYRYILHLKKYSHTPIPKELESSALKARYSSHTVTHDEINALLSFANSIKDEILTCSALLKRLYYEYIVVI